MDSPSWSGLNPILNYLTLGIYIVAIAYTVIKLLLDTHSTPKTLAYLLIVILLPVFGMILYYTVGINYRHLKLKNRGLASEKRFVTQFTGHITDDSSKLVQEYGTDIGPYTELIQFIHQLGQERLTLNSCHLLINGEEKFPDVMKNLESARKFIHMEYYAWENDVRGNQIKEILLRKVKEGLHVRVLYDAYASRKIRRNIVKELREGGVEIYPIIKLKFTHLANRINHRDHRKVIIIDGEVGYTGGINISDRYDNSIDTGLYWRDTHIRITGPAVLNLQRHFLINWNVAQDRELQFDPELFPEHMQRALQDPKLVQIMAGGPISRMSNIMLTYARLFSLARKKLYITNPYFIPSETILDTLKQAAVSGADVRLLLPEKSDSAIVGAASKFYFRELLAAGVKIYLYKKGFVHAKTVVADSFVSVVGTANMDLRSFDLNFEIMSVTYGESFGRQLEEVFLNDLYESREVSTESWVKTSTIGRRLSYAVARLISSFL